MSAGVKQIRHIEDLKPDPRNANKGTPYGHSLIERSITKHGAGRSGLAARDGTMIAGNQTLEKMAELNIPVRTIHTDGSEWVVVIRDDIEPGSPEAAAMAVEDNRASEAGLDWDASVLAELAAHDPSVSLLWPDEAWAGLLQEIGEPADIGGAGDEFDGTPALDGPTRCQPGDLWEIGPHRLLVGDCTDPLILNRLMQGEHARFEFTDPPYELGEIGGGIVGASAHRAAIREVGIDTFDPSQLILETPTAVFCCNKPLVPAYLRLAEQWGVAWDICFYLKENTVPNYGGHMMTDTEYLMLLGNQAPISGQEKALYSKGYIGGADIGAHVAWQKPVGLVEKYICLYSERNTIILDRFAGTGTTLIAAHQTGRRAFLCERDPKMADVILARASAAHLPCVRQQDSHA